MTEYILEYDWDTEVFGSESEAVQFADSQWSELDDNDRTEIKTYRVYEIKTESGCRNESDNLSAFMTRMIKDYKD